jgi:hypothetical protein
MITNYIYALIDPESGDASDQDAIRTAIAGKQKVKDLAVRYGVHRTTISKVNMGTYDAR